LPWEHLLAWGLRFFLLCQRCSLLSKKAKLQSGRV